MSELPLIELKQFIQAIRDSGYRGTHNAVAELVDNAFEANAGTVHIEILAATPHDTHIIVTDNGSGMNPITLTTALQFGGSNRFGSRSTTGRFGMGLPNSSLSQARRVDVYTWSKQNATYWSYLDVDEIVDGSIRNIPKPRKRILPKQLKLLRSRSGTVVQWSKCDRLSYRHTDSLKKLLHMELGRIFRKQLWRGKNLMINKETVSSVDPLFLRAGNNLVGATTYGERLEYEIKLPQALRVNRTSKVSVIFSQLPVEKWFSLSNKEKRTYNISKKAGVSVLRAGREIDSGWYFMGDKRKENYDDWWRCEIEFSPEVDELFGVTHTKQGINPSEEILSILTPDIEGIARKLNARVRSTFMRLKEVKLKPSERRASECDVFFEPPYRMNPNNKGVDLSKLGLVKFGGFIYSLKLHEVDTTQFFSTSLRNNTLNLNLNEMHPFVQRFYLPLSRYRTTESATVRKYVELLLFAAARAEHQVRNSRESYSLKKFKSVWSDVLAAFLA